VPAIRRALELWGQSAPVAQPEPEGVPVRSFLHALRLAEGCHDYSGGHDGENLQAYHDGIGTVVEVLKRAAVAGPWDSQTCAVFAAGISGAATPPAPEPGEVEELAELLMAVCATRGFDGWRCDAVRRAATLLQQLTAPTPIVPPTLIRALELAEAGLADIGDAEREPGDDLAWAEARAARGLPRIRQALNLWRDQAAAAPVAWCRSDEFANAMNRGGSFNGWRDPGAGVNKCDMQLYAIPLPATTKELQS
jgi:hypothetical protein